MEIKRAFIYVLAISLVCLVGYKAVDYYFEQRNYNSTKQDMVDSLSELDAHKMEMFKAAFAKGTIERSVRENLYKDITKQFVTVNKLYMIAENRGDQELFDKINDHRLAVWATLSPIKHYGSSRGDDNLLDKMDRVISTNELLYLALTQ